MSMQLKHFQTEAIEQLKQSFYELWRGGNRGVPLVFKSPTGSGKTIMIAEFLCRVSGEASFNPDKCFIWISKGELANQSKQKLEQYYRNGLPWTKCLDLEDRNNGVLLKNEIFFVNWEKVLSTAKENRKLRVGGEGNISFDELITNTYEQNREIILIIDESHLNLPTDLAKEIIRLIKPRIEIHISATPKNIPTIDILEDLKAGYVSVKHSKVITEELIKEDIQIMPKEEIEALDSENQDLDELLIDLALEKQQQLQQAYDEISVNVKPLILIQLPNDEKEEKATRGQNKLEFSKAYLKTKNIYDDEIAVWLSAKKENLTDIIKNNSPIKVLIFKQAIATGWDCPRAQILVSFREIKNPVFEIQVLGRILRMPEAKHYNNPILNKSYCYTNYAKKEVSRTKELNRDNLPKVHFAKLKKSIENIALSSVFLGRVDYGDMGDSFSQTFIEVANQYFGLTVDNDLKQLRNKGLEIDNININNQLIVNAKIEVYDDFINQLKNADKLDHQASYNDIKKLYDLLLYREIAHQEESSKFGNIARSYGKLKSALHIWLKQFIPSNPPLYAVVCNDLLKDSDSVLKKVIEKALKDYKLIREAEVLEKAKRKKQKLTFSLLSEYVYNDKYQLYEAKKYALDKCYLNNDSELEQTFIDYLEKQNIDWWYKNPSNGRDGFAIEYTDNHKLKAFYPDFLVRQGSRLGIFDTKGGFTATEAGPKAQALYDYCKQHKANNVIGVLKNQSKIELVNGTIELWGGIVQLSKNGVFKIHYGKDYNTNLDEWDTVSF